MPRPTPWEPATVVARVIGREYLHTPAKQLTGGSARVLFNPPA